MFVHSTFENNYDTSDIDSQRIVQNQKTSLNFKKWQSYFNTKIRKLLENFLIEIQTLFSLNT